MLPIVRSFIGKLRRFYEKAGENPRKIGRFLSCVRVGRRRSTVEANEGSVVFEVGMGGVQKNPHFLRLEMGIVVNGTGVN